MYKIDRAKEDQRPSHACVNPVQPTTLVSNPSKHEILTQGGKISSKSVIDKSSHGIQSHPSYPPFRRERCSRRHTSPRRRWPSPTRLYRAQIQNLSRARDYFSWLQLIKEEVTEELVKGYVEEMLARCKWLDGSVGFSQEYTKKCVRESNKGQA